MTSAEQKKAPQPFSLIPVSCSILRNEQYNLTADPFFSITYLQKGSCACVLNNHHRIFSAPAILCLNNRDRLQILQTDKLYGIVIQFDSCFIHNDFNVDNLAEHSADRLKSHLDYYMIHPFIFRNQRYLGHIPVGPNSQHRLLTLLKGLINEVENTYKNTYFCLCWRRSFLVETLITISRIFYKQDQNVDATFLNHSIANSALCNRILLYLHENSHQHISIKLLSKRFAINRTTLSEMVKSACGMTIIDYLTHIRILRAKTLLADSDLNVSQICYKSGFNDVSHFGRTFRKLIGMSPTDFRRLC